MMKQPADYAGYDDERLIGLIAQAQTEALDQLYERYSRPVFSLVLMIVGDRATAEEITLDVFMRVWQKAASYRADQAKVSTWLTHIARHHAIDVLRRRSVRLDQSALSWDEISPEGIPPTQDPQELAEHSLRRDRVRAAIARLPAEQKQVLMLAYFGGYTQTQIAEALHQPLGTVKTRIKLAMHKLRDFLHDEHESGDKSARAVATYNMSEED
ncbi:MAG TPA: sigma-70 family RNA polymerase sigma factor [Anaerolineales bacterium]|nr:sigma-70 family RNA polymerase sigma factor [Anaerolineales bacterium]